MAKNKSFSTKDLHIPLFSFKKSCYIKCFFLYQSIKCSKSKRRLERPIIFPYQPLSVVDRESDKRYELLALITIICYRVTVFDNETAVVIVIFSLRKSAIFKRSWKSLHFFCDIDFFFREYQPVC